MQTPITRKEVGLIASNLLFKVKQPDLRDPIVGSVGKMDANGDVRVSGTYLRSGRTEDYRRPGRFRSVNYADRFVAYVQFGRGGFDENAVKLSGLQTERRAIPAELSRGSGYRYVNIDNPDSPLESMSLPESINSVVERHAGKDAKILDIQIKDDSKPVAFEATYVKDTYAVTDEAHRLEGKVTRAKGVEILEDVVVPSRALPIDNL